VLCQHQVRIGARKGIHTATDDHPDKVEKEIIKPEVISFRSAILNIQQTSSVIKNITVDLAYRYDNL
jgi:hypothetical protein